MIDGPRLEPLSGAARRLVVILHGYGAAGRDLIGLGAAWRQHLPDAAFVAPDAPQACDHMPDGRQWFSLTLRDPHEYWTGCLAARPVLDAFLDAELSRLGLADGDLALVGFSQGCMMALHVGLRRSRTAAAIVGYSGRMAGLDHVGEIAVRPRVTLIHGELDDVIHAECMVSTAAALRGAGVLVDHFLLAGIGHEIDGRGERLGREAIVCAFATSPTA